MLHAPSPGMISPRMFSFSGIPLKIAETFNASITLSPWLSTGVFWLHELSSSFNTITPNSEGTDEKAFTANKSANPDFPSIQYAEEYFTTPLIVILESSIRVRSRPMLGEPARGVIMITILSITPAEVWPSIVEIFNPVDTSCIVSLPVVLDLTSNSLLVDKRTYTANPAVSTNAINTIKAPIPSAAL